MSKPNTKENWEDFPRKINGSIGIEGYTDLKGFFYYATFENCKLLAGFIPLLEKKFFFILFIISKLFNFPTFQFYVYGSILLGPLWYSWSYVIKIYKEKSWV